MIRFYSKLIADLSAVRCGPGIDKYRYHTTLPNMRALACILCATQAGAWEASRVGPVCYLNHETDAAKITVSHDATKPEPYAIELDRAAGWQPGPIFAMRFDGLGPLTITTDRHTVTDTTLTVTDSGFGNVLDGLAQNFVALATSGDTALVIPLEGAAPEVEKFRSCSANVGV